MGVLALIPTVTWERTNTAWWPAISLKSNHVHLIFLSHLCLIPTQKIYFFKNAQNSTNTQGLNISVEWELISNMIIRCFKIRQILKKPPNSNEWFCLTWHCGLVSVGRERVWAHQCKYTIYLPLCKRPMSSSHIKKSLSWSFYNT